MKIEAVADILKILKPILTAKTVLYTTLVVAAAFWVGFLFPQVFTLFRLDTWRAKNDTLIGMGVIISSIILLIALLVNLDDWISPRLRRRRKKRSVHSLFRNLSSSELQYLYQFIRHKTLTIEFDETDPVVGLLQTKGIIYRRPYPLPGEPFSISPTNYQYLTDHPELFWSVVSEEKP
jgi:hypothetical protein